MRTPGAIATWGPVDAVGAEVMSLDRIADELGVTLSKAVHCARVAVPLGEGLACEAVVCAFPYPAAGPCASGSSSGAE